MPRPTQRRCGWCLKIQIASALPPPAEIGPKIIRRRRSLNSTGTSSRERCYGRTHRPPSDRARSLPLDERLGHLHLTRFGNGIPRQHAVEHVPLNLPVRHRREVEDEEAQMASEKHHSRTLFGRPREPEHGPPQKKD